MFVKSILYIYNIIRRRWRRQFMVKGWDELVFTIMGQAAAAAVALFDCRTQRETLIWESQYSAADEQNGLLQLSSSYSYIIIVHVYYIIIVRPVAPVGFFFRICAKSALAMAAVAVDWQSVRPHDRIVIIDIT